MVLKRLRRERGWSQEMLAERAAISVPAVAALECGMRRTPYPKTIARLADALGLGAAGRTELQAAAAAAKAARNAAAAAAPAAGGLPAAIAPIVGRNRETAELRAILRQARLVTVIGPGGIGKTTLALEVAREVCQRFRHGAIFCDFAPLTNGALLPSAVASALGAALRDDREAHAALAALVGRAELLLVFDNCEHLAPDVARLANCLLASCERATILATSRRPLRTVGETLYPVPPLATLAPGGRGTLIDAAAAGAAAAVELFVQRATAVDPSFALTDANAADIASICRRLDGMALAIELAAAQLRLMSVAELERRLAHQMRLLGDVALDAGGRRSRTLRATFDWSYALLRPPQQRFFRALGIFAGSFTLEAALGVCCEADADELDALALIGALVDASLLVVDGSGVRTRFRYLETTRAYANELLLGAGERAAVAERHLACLRARVAELDAAYDLEDVRAALHWSQHGGDVSAGADLLARFGTRWTRVGLTAEGVQQLEACIPHIPDDDPETTARAWVALAFMRGQLLMRLTPALAAARTAVETARRCGDPAVLFNALRARAMYATLLAEHDEGDAALREAGELLEMHPSPVRSVLLLDTQGITMRTRGDLAGAARTFRASCAIARGLGDPYLLIGTINNLADAEHEAGNTKTAVELLLSLRADPALGGIQNDHTLGNLAGYLVALGEDDAAIEQARELVTRRAAAPWGGTFVTAALEHVALVHGGRGDGARAARLAGFCAASYASIGYERQYTERRSHELLCALLDHQLTPAQRADFEAEGAVFSQERAVREAFGKTVG
jgi:predicted ATPase/DNA-binding XRE family transcriptional regulator